ncbi:MAG: hypothetical protein ACK5Z0_00130, partial [Planctomycetota bacterium]
MAGSFNTYVKRRDAKGQRDEAGGFQAGGGEAFDKKFVGREFADALREIVVGVRAVLGELLSNPRQDVFEVPL